MSRIVPVGYLTFREVAAKIEDALFAGVPDRAVILKLRETEGHVADGKANQEAVLALWKAVDKGRLPAFAIGGRQRRTVRLSPDTTQGIPALRRCGDFTFLRPRNEHYAQVVAWFGLDLANVTLAFRERDLDKLLPTIRRTRRRASSSGGPKKGVGRPNLLSEVKACIWEMIDQRKWESTQSMKALTLQVIRKSQKTVSEDTVTRALDQLYEETNDRKFQRHRKSRMP